MKRAILVLLAALLAAGLAFAAMDASAHDGLVDRLIGEAAHWR